MCETVVVALVGTSFERVCVVDSLHHANVTAQCISGGAWRKGGGREGVILLSRRGSGKSDRE